jgi:hypothetical protein
MLGVGALRGGAMRFGLVCPGAAIMLQHDLVFLFHLFTKKTHECSYLSLSIMRDGRGDHAELLRQCSEAKQIA